MMWFSSTSSPKYDALEKRVKELESKVAALTALDPAEPAELTAVQECGCIPRYMPIKIPDFWEEYEKDYNTLKKQLIRQKQFYEDAQKTDGSAQKIAEFDLLKIIINKKIEYLDLEYENKKLKRERDKLFSFATEAIDTLGDMAQEAALKRRPLSYSEHVDVLSMTQRKVAGYKHELEQFSPSRDKEGA